MNDDESELEMSGESDGAESAGAEIAGYYLSPSGVIPYPMRNASGFYGFIAGQDEGGGEAEAEEGEEAEAGESESESAESEASGYYYAAPAVAGKGARRGGGGGKLKGPTGVPSNMMRRRTRFLPPSFIFDPNPYGYYGWVGGVEEEGGGGPEGEMPSAEEMAPPPEEMAPPTSDQGSSEGGGSGSGTGSDSDNTSGSDLTTGGGQSGYGGSYETIGSGGDQPSDTGLIVGPTGDTGYGGSVPNPTPPEVTVIPQPEIGPPSAPPTTLVVVVGPTGDTGYGGSVPNFVAITTPTDTSGSDLTGGGGETGHGGIITLPTPMPVLVPGVTPRPVPVLVPGITPRPIPVLIPTPTPTPAPAPTPTPVMVPTPTPTPAPAPTPGGGCVNDGSACGLAKFRLCQAGGGTDWLNASCSSVFQHICGTPSLFTGCSGENAQIRQAAGCPDPSCAGGPMRKGCTNDGSPCGLAKQRLCEAGGDQSWLAASCVTVAQKVCGDPSLFTGCVGENPQIRQSLGCPDPKCAVMIPAPAPEVGVNPLVILGAIGLLGLGALLITGGAPQQEQPKP